MDEIDCIFSENNLIDHNYDSKNVIIRQCLSLLDKYQNCLTLMTNNCKCDENIGYKLLFNDLLSKYRKLIDYNALHYENINTLEHNYSLLCGESIQPLNNESIDCNENVCVNSNNDNNMSDSHLTEDSDSSINCFNSDFIVESDGQEIIDLTDDYDCRHEIIDLTDDYNEQTNENNNINKSGVELNNISCVTETVNRNKQLNRDNLLVNDNETVLTNYIELIEFDNKIISAKKVGEGIDGNSMFVSVNLPLIYSEIDIQNNNNNNNNVENKYKFFNKRTRNKLNDFRKQFKHECDVCHQWFRSDSSYKEHCNVKGNECFNRKPFKCKHCNSGFSSSLHIREHSFIHMDNVSKELKRMYCCDRYFYSDSAFNTHQMVKHSERRTNANALKCELCAKSFKWVTNLQKHRNRIHAQNKKYACNWSKCEFKTTVKSQYTVHIKRHLNRKIYSCDYNGCEFKAVTNAEIMSHRRTHSLVKDIACPHCKRMFKTKQYLRYHVMSEHQNNKQYECAKCLKSFVTRTQLASHLLIHSEMREICEICGFKTYRKHLLLNHVKRVHQDIEDRLYRCSHSQCKGKSFALKNDLNGHLKKVHCSERTFMCDWPECGKAFKVKSTLKHHINCHTRLNYVKTTKK